MKVRFLVLCGVIVFICICILVLIDDTDGETQAPAGSHAIDVNGGGLIADSPKIAYERLMDPERIRKASEKAEAKRYENWKSKFPWPPTHDPSIDLDTVLTSRYASSVDLRQAHRMLTKFYADEARYSSQFEQTYRVFEKHGMAKNPLPIIGIFHSMRRYAEAAKPLPGELLFENGKLYPKTWGEISEREFKYIVAGLTSGSNWLDISVAYDENEKRAYEIARELVATVKNMCDLPELVMDYGQSTNGILPDERTQFLSGQKQLLVPYVGWFDDCEKYWDDKLRNIEIGIEKGGVDLFLHGIAEAKLDQGYKAFFKGMEVPVRVDEDGTLVLPSPEEVQKIFEQRQRGNAGFPDQ